MYVNFEKKKKKVKWNVVKYLKITMKVAISKN